MHKNKYCFPPGKRKGDIMARKKETIAKADLERVSGIARLRPNMDELDGLVRDANAILEYFSLIAEIPDAKSKPGNYVLGQKNGTRPDLKRASDPKAIRRGFAREQDGYMRAQKSM